MTFNNISSYILHFLTLQTIYSALLFGAVAFLSFVLRRKSPLLRFALWMLVLFRLILPPDLSHPLSLRNLSQEFLHMHEGTMELRINSYTHEEVLSPAQDTAKTEASLSTHWRDVAFVTWIAGFLFSLLLFLAKRWRWYSIMRSASGVTNRSLSLIAREWQDRFGIKRRVILKSSAKVRMPFTIGIRRPVIVLPATLVHDSRLEQSVRANGDDSVYKAIIAHEMAHIKRFDDLWIIVQNILQSIYFFHPAVWLTNRQIYIARECICDSLVLAQRTLSRQAYGRGLITSFKSSFWGLESTGVLAAFSSPHKIARARISNIKKGQDMKIPLYLKIAFFVTAVIFLPMAASQSKQPVNAASAPVIAAKTSIEFRNPLKAGTYKLTSTYGQRKHPITGEIKFHRAIDLAAKEGTPVQAAADGTVEKAVTEFEQGKGMGQYIQVRHKDGYMTRYTQLHHVSVEANQTVQAGEEIGQVGSTGISTGPHLHFEIWKDGEHVNPADYIAF